MTLVPDAPEAGENRSVVRVQDPDDALKSPGNTAEDRTRSRNFEPPRFALLSAHSAAYVNSSNPSRVVPGEGIEPPSATHDVAALALSYPGPT